MQVLNYIQLVWELIIAENNMDSNTELYHGAVEAIYTVIGKYNSYTVCVHACVCIYMNNYDILRLLI